VTGTLSPHPLRSGSATWEHMFLTAHPHAHVRFSRAIERRALWMAEDAAREPPNLPLPLRRWGSQRA
jgi:hypothetical protein